MEATARSLLREPWPQAFEKKIVPLEWASLLYTFLHIFLMFVTAWFVQFFWTLDVSSISLILFAFLNFWYLHLLPRLVVVLCVRSDVSSLQTPGRNEDGVLPLPDRWVKKCVKVNVGVFSRGSDPPTPSKWSIRGKLVDFRSPWSWDIPVNMWGWLVGRFGSLGDLDPWGSDGSDDWGDFV